MVKAHNDYTLHILVYTTCHNFLLCYLRVVQKVPCLAIHEELLKAPHYVILKPFSYSFKASLFQITRAKCQRQVGIYSISLYPYTIHMFTLNFVDNSCKFCAIIIQNHAVQDFGPTVCHFFVGSGCSPFRIFSKFADLDLSKSLALYTSFKSK